MERAFRGVWITAGVYLDDSLDPYDIIILAEIDSLDNEDGCYASNEYLAKFCKCSPSKVSKSVSKLLKLGYIRKESFDGRTRVLRSNLSNSESLPSTKSEADWHEMPAIEVIDNYKPSSKDEGGKTFRKPTVEEIEAYCKEKGYTYTDAEGFFDYYESVGWLVGKNKPMRDWKASVRRWERDEKSRKGAREVTDDASAKFRGL